MEKRRTVTHVGNCPTSKGGKRRKKRQISVHRQPRRSPDPCWEKGRGRHGCGEGKGRRSVCSQGGLAGGWGHSERWVPGSGMPLWGWVCPSISPAMQLFPPVPKPSPSVRKAGMLLSQQRCPQEDISEVCPRPWVGYFSSLTPKNPSARW